MDVILDTNIFVQDFRMERTHFQELFRYLRRTDSLLVLPKVVFQETVQRYRNALFKTVGDLKAAWDAVRGKALSDVEEYKGLVDVDHEVSLFKKRLRKPAPKVKVYSHDDYSCVNVEEVVRRGVERIRPANANGEELRDVILWLMVLAYAKKKRSSVAFISNDGTFRDPQGNLNETLAADLAREDAQIAYYEGVSAFITGNSLETEDLSEKQFLGFVDRKAINREAEGSFGQSEMFWGKAQKVKVDNLDFVSAKKYRVAEDSFYIEGFLAGSTTITVAQPTMLEQSPFVAESVVYPFSQAIAISVESGSPYRNIHAQVGGAPFLFAYQQASTQSAAGDPEKTLFNQTYSGGVPLSSLALVDTEKSYECGFELEVSARLEAGKLIALQIDEWKISQVKPVPTRSKNKQ